jgi:hypothetical protein
MARSFMYRLTGIQACPPYTGSPDFYLLKPIPFGVLIFIGRESISTNVCAELVSSSSSQPPYLPRFIIQLTQILQNIKSRYEKFTATALNHSGTSEGLTKNKSFQIFQIT